MSTATGLASLTSEGVSMQSAVSSFAETAKVMIKGLEALAQVHPAIGVAVIAFKLVVTFDMTRRENNKKILALKIEMQDMMAVLFELRHIRDPMEKGPDGSPLGARMQKLMTKIANDIKDVGSACDAYLKKSFLARTLKSKIYESRLADYGSKFESNKTEIQRCLSMHTARGVDTANEKLDAQGLKIDEMTSKFDQVLTVFRQLDSPREVEIQRFFEENGGVKACIEDDELLYTLVSKGGQEASEAGDDLLKTRKVLLKEFHEDIDKMLEDHTVLFQGKLDIQSKQLDAIQAILTSGSHDKIVDRDLKTIWKEMGWKGSVKARHFVLALHDYYSEGSFLASQESNTPSGSPVVLSPDPMPVVDDRWTLSYINVTRVQPILESVDDDGTGFVSIKEVNNFVTSRPLGWTLLQRLAYWAAGWHLSILSYRNKIYKQVRKIFKLLDHLMPANQALVEDYLKSVPLLRIEHVLRSTKSVETRHDAELTKLIDLFEKMEEERLTQNLAAVGYELDSAETVGLVTGPGRIERYLFPLVYLLLKRDLRIIMLACKCVIREDELWLALDSIRSVFRVVDERINRMTGIFKQVHADVEKGLGMFAFGMFQLYYDKLYGQELFPVIDKDSSYLKWREDTSQANEVENLQDEINSLSNTELKYGPMDLTPVFQELQSSYAGDMPDDTTIQGRWSGNFWYSRQSGSVVSVHGLTELQIDAQADGNLAGAGQNSVGFMTISGTLDADNVVKLSMKYQYGYPIVCEGKFYPDLQKIDASWQTEDLKGDGQEDYRYITFWRTPAHLNRYRTEMANRDISLACARWAFARKAILHEVGRKSWSWTFLKARISEATRLLPLSIRHATNYSNVTPNNKLDQDETDALYSLRTFVPVHITRMFVAFADFHISRLMLVHRANCDSCQRSIYDTRLICLACVDKDFTNTLDICRSCMTTSTSRDELHHNPSHSMIKYEHVVRDFNEVWSSRTLVIRAKAALTTPGETITTPDEREGQEAAPASHDTPADGSGPPKPTTSILCFACSKALSIPCWVCRICTPDIFLCLDCEEKRVTSPDGHTHKLNHPLVRIGTIDPDPPIRAEKTDTEARLAALENRVDARTTQLEIMVQERTTQLEKILQDHTTQLGTMVQNVQEGTSQLETRVEERLSQLDAKVQERLVRLETKIQEQFSSLESLLRQVISTQVEGGPRAA
ncbi:hypothetical protein BDN72DRAFT_962870 [Pluteus cervinus]|uniref:Uncharacterized protein n=1 Tax=Pluteus cervinus TaxID=181527 RepID=A0ACD3AGU6_9AGAR|nr:hypothetical protein BDN72DRAFT_962870 [Pluteus cervinus]